MIKLFEKFENISEVKDVIFLKAINTYDLNLIKFFVKKGYDINTQDAIYNATYSGDVLRYFLENGADVKDLNNDWHTQNQLRIEEVQKILIDFGYENFIYDTVGFNKNLKKDPKYSDIVERFEDTEKYNL